MYFQLCPNYMSMGGVWQGEFICAVRKSIIHTSDIDKLAHEVIKTKERALSPADVPRSRIRKYL